MKLKNKRTGEVQKIYPSIADTDNIKFMAEGGKHYEYETLAELVAEWGDK